MSEGILGNATGGFGFPKTYIITDSDGNELTGVYVESETIFTATDNDVREGMVYAGDAGVSTGTKNIPSYHTSYGCKIVLADTELSVSIPEYDYNDLFVSVATYDTSWAQSVCTTYISIDGGMYIAGSDTKVSDITIDDTNEKINLGITTSEKSVVRYIVTREEF